MKKSSDENGENCIKFIELVKQPTLKGQVHTNLGTGIRKDEYIKLHLTP